MMANNTDVFSHIASKLTGQIERDIDFDSDPEYDSRANYLVECRGYKFYFCQERENGDQSFAVTVANNQCPFAFYTLAHYIYTGDYIPPGGMDGTTLLLDAVIFVLACQQQREDLEQLALRSFAEKFFLLARERTNFKHEFIMAMDYISENLAYSPLAQMEFLRIMQPIIMVYQFGPWMEILRDTFLPMMRQQIDNLAEQGWLRAENMLRTAELRQHMYLQARRAREQFRLRKLPYPKVRAQLLVGVIHNSWTPAFNKRGFG